MRAAGFDTEREPPDRRAQNVADIIAAESMPSVDVLVLAGGLGTRIRPVLGDTPKLLAPIGDRPFLSYCCSGFTRFGARRVVLALGHAAAAVEDYLRDACDPALEVVTVVEPRPLGSAGAVRLRVTAAAARPKRAFLSKN
jgi:bifunctional N-acetylglucosamine-1-phosphate-uridyltransferase/glucosamine-1-phosphate-acetyltransferase GlmU-like protein